MQVALLPLGQHICGAGIHRLDAVPQWLALFIQQIDAIAVPGVADAGNLFWTDARFGQHLANGAGRTLPQHFHITLCPPGMWILSFGSAARSCNFLPVVIKESGFRDRTAVIDAQKKLAHGLPPLVVVFNVLRLFLSNRTDNLPSNH